MQQFSEDSMRRIARSVIQSEKRLRGSRERRRRYTGRPSESRIYIGKLDSSVTTGSTGTLSLYSDSITDTGDNLTVKNLTGQTLLSAVWIKAFKPVGWTEYLAEPYMLEPC